MDTKITGFASIQLEKMKREVDNDIDRLSMEIAKAFKGHSRHKTKFLLKQALLLGKLSRQLSVLLSAGATKRRQTYVISALFLHDCFKLLNARKVESLHFVTGPQLENISVLDRIVDFKLETQNPVFARGDSDSVRRALIELSKYEHRLQGCFHIHPGRGIHSTEPSSIDLRLQQTLDRGGYRLVNAIFSRDGIIRFYSSRAFEIQVYGKGVEKINGKFYRLTQVG
jgi:proteasome lid subunit RPN8/RPN11